MANVLKLGFKQSPSGTDDFIDLGGGSNTGTNGDIGYKLISYSEGTTRTDSYGRLVRDLTITVSVKGSSVANSYFKFTEINRFLQRTRMYFEQFSGNIPGQTDLQWHTGRAATLSFLAQGQTTVVFWDVLDGQAVLPQNTLLGPNNQAFLIEPVVIKITVNAANRQAAVILDNVFPMGDFEFPFTKGTDGSVPTTGGWNVSSVITLDTTTYKFGTRSIKISGVISPIASITSLDIYPPENCTVVVSFWLIGTLTGGTGSFKLQTLQNTTFTDQIVFNTGTTIPGWTQYSTSPISLTANVKFNAALIATNLSSNTTYNLNVDGFGCFRNPVGGVAPTEFFCYGGTGIMPSANAYGIKGDIEAPFLMALNYTNAGSPSLDFVRYFLMGVMPIKWGTDAPLLSLSLNTASGTANGSYWFGAQGAAVTGSPLTGTSTFPMTGTAIGTKVSGRPRKYRAYMVYYSSFTTGPLVTKVAITLANDTRNYVITSNSNGTNTATPLNENYSLYELGDFLFPRPGTIGTERTSNISSSDNVAVTFNSGAAGVRFMLAGILLLPAEQFVYIDLGVQTNSYNPIISNESTAVKAQLAAQTTGTAVSTSRSAGDKNSTYQSSGLLIELNSLSTASFYTADAIELEPGDTHFEMIAATSNSQYPSGQVEYQGTIFTSLQPTLIYAPRNLTSAV